MAKKRSLVDMALELPRIGGAAAGSASAAPIKGARRNDPAYRQISVRVNVDLYRRARKRLLDGPQNFSELVDELLTKWLERE